MKLTIVLVFFFLAISTNSFADRVCIRKADGVPIEFQSGDSALGSLTENAVAAGYQKDAVEEKYITEDEYAALKKEKLDDPKQVALDKIKTDATARIKTKLNVSDNDLTDLRRALQ